MTSDDAGDLVPRMNKLEWYHTVELAPGVFTPGRYDHRAYLHHYPLPDDLTGRRALDVGAASGFFSFELERRGAAVTALDLPTWMDHDFGPRYRADRPLSEAERYLREPLAFAKEARGSSVDTVYASVYDLDPEIHGMFDLVFCGSMLLHVTDPMRALWRIREVTGGEAIIATGISKDRRKRPLAEFHGAHDGTIWWLPNRTGLERMLEAAGFDGWDWVSTFRLDPVDGSRGIEHGVVRAWSQGGAAGISPT
jgi:tRNA (mo5U34)-methyltransferase